MTATRSRCAPLVLLCAAVLLGPALPAHAQSFIAPFIGYDFGGNAKCPQISQLPDCEDKGLNFGIGLGYLGPVFGFEEEFAYADDFFGTSPGMSSSVLTVMSSVILSPRLRPIRPYFLVGAGLIKTKVDLNIESLLTNDDNSWGWNIGGGAMIGSEHVAVKGEVRYFHSFDPFEFIGFGPTQDKLDFGRASVGVVFSF